MRTREGSVRAVLQALGQLLPVLLACPLPGLQLQGRQVRAPGEGSAPLLAGFHSHRLRHVAQQLLFAQRILFFGLEAWGFIPKVGRRPEGTTEGCWLLRLPRDPQPCSGHP